MMGLSGQGGGGGGGKRMGGGIRGRIEAGGVVGFSKIRDIKSKGSRKIFLLRFFFVCEYYFAKFYLILKQTKHVCILKKLK